MHRRSGPRESLFASLSDHQKPSHCSPISMSPIFHRMSFPRRNDCCWFSLDKAVHELQLSLT